MNSTLFQMYLVRAERFHERLEQWLFAETRVFDAEVLVSPEPLDAEERPQGNYVPIKEMEPWGNLWDSGYFKLTGTVPDEWQGAEVWLDLEMGGEILLYDENYAPLAQLTNTCTLVRNYRKTLFPAQISAVPGKLTFYAEVAVNDFAKTKDGDMGFCRKLHYGKFNREVWALLNDFRTILFLLRIHQRPSDLPSMPPFANPGGFHWKHGNAPGPTNHRALKICTVLNQAIDAFAENPSNATAARAVLQEELKRPAQTSEHSTIAVGHTHLDCGYLWKLHETTRKACRTFAGQLFNTKFYPGYVFGISQPQVYEWVRERMPRLFDEVCEAVRDGLWELQGGMWVEADCMVPSGESLIRQFLHGKNYWKEHFGIDVRNVWLPDAFGFTGALPQIMKACGCRYLTSQKIAWNEFNQFPYHSFRWRGLDGTEVLAHFLPEENYNAFMEPCTLRWGEDNFKEGHIASEFLTTFGAGDGGGGPKMEHIEAGIRAANLEDTPRVSFGRAADFFGRMEDYADKLPEWDGEIPLELHRGTLTNQGRTKRWMRHLEQKTVAVEMLFSSGPECAWPRLQLDRIWKRLLLFQFHDIVTGSSIKEVMDVVEKDCAAINVEEDDLLDDFARRFCKNEPNSITFVQTMNCGYNRLLRLPESWQGCEVTDDSGQSVPIQMDDLGICAKINLPPLSSMVLHRKEGMAKDGLVKFQVATDEVILENHLIRCRFESNGRLSSLYDKRLEREMLCDGGGNKLTLHVDMPRKFEGWEVEYVDRDIPAQNAIALESPKMTVGALRSFVQFRLVIGNSTIEQTAVLEADSSRVDFITSVDWRETQRRLRVNFHIANDASDAYGEVQHGFMRRSLRKNTSYDLASFEHVAHRWYDISDDRGGIACLNNGRYGHEAGRHWLALTLLRSPLQVDVTHDNGKHVFTYSVYSHQGDFIAGKVPEEAFQLNREPLCLEGVSEVPWLPFVLDADGVDVDAFKRAENDDSRIIRLHEFRGRHCTAKLHVGKALRLTECDAMEWTDSEPLYVDDEGIVTLEFRPFEFKTLRME
ncbi:MAG: alpha-mannosidase [Victivallales bacterium]|nr:alpha-mannosidase [Victivallales bacterium]